jgi:SNF2 family DNA or RNA helicase
MTLEEWQIGLRLQCAQTEYFSITTNPDNDETGCYSVYNPKTKNVYKVIYRGPDSKWNYCSCLDFKSNQLGTCKHVEAVRLWLVNNNQVPATEFPTYTSVYLSYRTTRTVCIRYGSDNREQFMQLASHYFDSYQVLKPEMINTFASFLNEASKINNNFRCYPDVLQYIVEQRGHIQRKALVNEKCDDGVLDTLLHTKLYPYQKEGVRFAIAAGKCIIADEMGLGKTIQAVATAELYRQEDLVSSVLVICPSSLKYQWKKEIERFTDTSVVIVEGNFQQRKLLYKSDDFYKIVSYNSVCSDIKSYGSLWTDMLIMDEAQRLKNWNTQIAKAVRHIESNYTVVLTGTPLENKLQELYSIVQFVDQYCLGPYYKFVDLTTVTSSETGQIVGYKNLNVVGKLLSGIMIRRLKKDVSVQLPERTDKNLFVPMTRQQRLIHDEYRTSVAQIVYKWRKMHFLSDNDRKRLLLLLSQMRMVCDSTFILDQKSRHDTKIEEAINIVKELKENGGTKIVIFSQWERMTHLICSELDKLDIGYSNLNGNVSSVGRKELLERFTDDDHCLVFVSTDTGSVGLNLQMASVLINLDIPWNPSVLEQRIARIHRIGQQNNVQVINLIAEQTIEERMLSTLDFKSSVAQGVLDSGADTVFLDHKKVDKLMASVDGLINMSEYKSISVDVLDEAEPAEPIQTTINFDIEENEYDNGITGIEKKDVSHSKYQSADCAHQVLEKGASFLSTLSETLSSREKTEALLNEIVKVDPSTGKTKLELPIPDKQSVEQILRFIGNIFSKSQ